jgi:hypothetical protein
LDSAIQIDAGEGPLWYFPRSTRFGGNANDYTGPFNISAVPLSFSRPVTINRYQLRYQQGANSAAFAAAGAGAVMFRGAIYAADVNGIPKTLVGDMGWTTYDPATDANDGIAGVNSFPAPINLEANKQYFLHFSTQAVTLSSGLPHTILPTDTFLVRTYTALNSPTDPMASVGIPDADFPYVDTGASAFFIQNVLSATMGTGNARNAYPATLGAFGSGVYLTSNPTVVAVRTEG